MQGALVPSPVMTAMAGGRIARVEELTRIPSDVQDALITILSEKTLPVPELGIEVQAAKGFSVIATANDRDRGVNDLSSALRRRFNTVVLPLPAITICRFALRRSSKLRTFAARRIHSTKLLLAELPIQVKRLRSYLVSAALMIGARAKPVRPSPTTGDPVAVRDRPHMSEPRTARADCNLLFGILALQMDFVTRDQLVAGMHAWVLTKGKPLGEILREGARIAAKVLVRGKLCRIDEDRHDHPRGAPARLPDERHMMTMTAPLEVMRRLRAFHRETAPLGISS